LAFDLSVVSRTNCMIAFLAGPSFQEGSGSCARVIPWTATIWSNAGRTTVLKPTCVIMMFFKLAISFLQPFANRVDFRDIKVFDLGNRERHAYFCHPMSPVFSPTKQTTRDRREGRAPMRSFSAAI
jgi:hypothetical protein